MQIFLCWSGKASFAIAKAMHTFLGDTIQELKPFLSSEDIRKGGRWNNEIGVRLAECNFGILCMTKENLDARWILFEAGALSKLPSSNVTAILAGIQPTDVREPLSQFQNTSVSHPEIFKLLEDINGLLPEGKRLDAGRLKRAFENNWPTLEKSIDDALKLKSPDPAVTASRSTVSMVTELLELVRELKRGSDTTKQLVTALELMKANPPIPSYVSSLGLGALSSLFPMQTSATPGGLGALSTIVPTDGISQPVTTTPLKTGLRTRKWRRPRIPE